MLAAALPAASIEEGIEELVTYEVKQKVKDYGVSVVKGALRHARKFVFLFLSNIIYNE